MNLRIMQGDRSKSARGFDRARPLTPRTLLLLPLLLLLPFLSLVLLVLLVLLLLYLNPLLQKDLKGKARMMSEGFADRGFCVIKVVFSKGRSDVLYEC